MWEACKVGVWILTVVEDARAPYAFPRYKTWVDAEHDLADTGTVDDCMKILPKQQQLLLIQLTSLYLLNPGVQIQTENCELRQESRRNFFDGSNDTFARSSKEGKPIEAEP